jgi:hypothetical protein
VLGTFFWFAIGVASYWFARRPNLQRSPIGEGPPDETALATG